MKPPNARSSGLGSIPQALETDGVPQRILAYVPLATSQPLRSQDSDQARLSISSCKGAWMMRRTQPNSSWSTALTAGPSALETFDRLRAGFMAGVQDPQLRRAAVFLLAVGAGLLPLMAGSAKAALTKLPTDGADNLLMLIGSVDGSAERSSLQREGRRHPKQRHCPQHHQGGTAGGHAGRHSGDLERRLMLWAWASPATAP